MLIVAHIHFSLFRFLSNYFFIRIVFSIFSRLYIERRRITFSFLTAMNCYFGLSLPSAQSFHSSLLSPYDGLLKPRRFVAFQPVELQLSSYSFVLLFLILFISQNTALAARLYIFYRFLELSFPYSGHILLLWSFLSLWVTGWL